MKLLIRILFLSLSCIPLFSSSQNLVPNPSFEDTANCKANYATIYVATPWFNSTIASPDYYTSFSQCGISSLNNPVGYQLPKSGLAYSGIYLWNDSTREYISIKLDSTLKAGKKYKTSLAVSPANNFMRGTDRIGVYFSQDTNGFYGPLQLLFTPQIENAINNIIVDTAKWTTITGTFIANGGESFLTIGNFYNNLNTNTVIINAGGFNGAYYYIDDVSVVRCDSCDVQGVYENRLASMNIFPNPFVNAFSIGSTNIGISQIEIFNLLGTPIPFSSTSQNNSTIQIVIDESHINEGPYFLKIFTSKEIYIRKIVKITNQN